jgi:transposase
MTTVVDVGSMRTKGSAAELEQRRQLAVRLLEQGLKGVQVAKALGVSNASVTRWKQAVEEGGQAALAAKPHPGGQPRLTAAQHRRLLELLLQGPRQHGYSTELWTLARVVQVIRRTFGVEYHPCHVWKVLRNLGWSSQKPERRAREQDPAAIAAWRQKHWPRIKKRPKVRPNAGRAG